MTRVHVELADDSPVLAALKAIRAEAYGREQAPGYAMASVRSLAGELGFAELLPDILEVCAANGFGYCLDETIPCGTDHELPDRNVCYWGCDQLRSRLDCVDWRLRQP
jgi:hypothetical protein